MRSGALPPVDVPKVAEEAGSGSGSRRDPGGAQGHPVAAHRLLAPTREPRHLGRSPLRWRSDVGGATPAPHIVRQESVRTVSEPTERLQRVDQERQATGTAWRLHPGVAARHALRGGPCTGAVTPGAALGDLTRFEHPRQRRKCLGLLPAASATGARRRQGALTQAENTPAHRALGAGAWASRDPATGSRPRPRRRAKQSTALQAISWKAQGRRCKRSRRLMARGQHAHQGGGAMARALLGCMGALATQVPGTASGHQRHGASTPNAAGCPRALEEPPPRDGAPRDGVQRPTGILGPRERQAPAGGKEGGPNPRIAAGATVASSWLRLCCGTKGKKHQEDVKKGALNP